MFKAYDFYEVRSNGTPIHVFTVAYNERYSKKHIKVELETVDRYADDTVADFNVYVDDRYSTMMFLDPDLKTGQERGDEIFTEFHHRVMRNESVPFDDFSAFSCATSILGALYEHAS